MKQRERYWSDQPDLQQIPEVRDLPAGTFAGDEKAWSSLTPGMRRTICREAIKRQSLRFKATMESAQALHSIDPDEDLWIPYAAVGRELLAAGLVAQAAGEGGRVMYRLTEAGKAWKSS